MNSIVIFGSNGMLGRTIMAYFQSLSGTYNVIGISRNEFEVGKDSPEKLYTLIPEKSIVINAIGMIPQKYPLKGHGGTQSILQYLYVNGTFPHILQQVVRQKEALLIHITTDCVYNGKIKKFYAIGSPPTETNMYGISKALGEPQDAMIIRTSIIGEAGSSESLLEWFRQCQDEKVKGFTHHFWNGVTCLELSKIIEHCIQNNVIWRGVDHVTSPKVVSKYDLLRCIKEVYNVKTEIVPEKTKKVRKTLAKGRHILVAKTIQEQIQEQKEFWKSLS